MELKPIDRTDRGKARLNAALTIYRETILPEAQNPERQILYWIEHSKEQLTDEFRCFSIQRKNEVIGYLQYSYFQEEKIFFFEYLCINDSKRKGLVPSEGIKSIENFLAQNYPPGFSIVFEVAQKRSYVKEWEPDTKLINYFKRLGFRRVDFDYHYPILQSYDGKASYPADILVWLPNQKTEISSSEMRTILRCIYFKHYLRWDRPFLEAGRFRERERLINELYSQKVTQISGNDTFGTSGDNKKSKEGRFKVRHPKISALLDKIFGPKLPRIIVVIGVLLLAQWVLGNGWLLAPFLLAVAAVYCLAEDTKTTRELFVAIISRLKFEKPQQ